MIPFTEDLGMSLSEKSRSDIIFFDFVNIKHLIAFLMI